MCEVKGSSRAPGGWNNGVRHSNDILQARAKVKNNKYKDVYGLVSTIILRLLRKDADFWLWAVLRYLGNCGSSKKFMRYILVFLSFLVKGSSDQYGESLRPNG